MASDRPFRTYKGCENGDKEQLATELFSRHTRLSHEFPLRDSSNPTINSGNNFPSYMGTTGDCYRLFELNGCNISFYTLSGHTNGMMPMTETGAFPDRPL